MRRLSVPLFALMLLPGVATIGVTAPLALLALRLLQGIAVGGEWAGSAVLVAEHAPGGERGVQRAIEIHEAARQVALRPEVGGRGVHARRVHGPASGNARLVHVKRSPGKSS